MPSDVAIRISGLGRYFGPDVGLRTVSAGSVWRHLRAVFGFSTPSGRADAFQHGVMTAGQVLKDISLEIEKHSIVCLDGPSGSGKSVLLKILAGLTPPTEGKVELFGNVSSLLKPGENLDDTLSALENIERERAMHGVAQSPEQYARDVIAFAEIQKFEHVLVGKFSTGMAMRLSLALALQGNPDILLLDNILSVGDIAFQQKCVERLLELKAAGCTMVLSLSDEGLVHQLATRVVTLKDGTVVNDNAPGTMLIGPYGFRAADVSWQIGSEHVENDAVALREITVEQVDGYNGLELEITIKYLAKLAPQRSRPSIFVLWGKKTLFRSVYPSFIAVSTPQLIQVVVHVPVHLLRDDAYVVKIGMLSLHEQRAHALKHNSAVKFKVNRGVRFEGAARPPFLAPAFPWDVEVLQEKA